MGTGRLRVDHATGAQGAGLRHGMEKKLAAGRGRVTGWITDRATEGVTEHALHAARAAPPGQGQNLTRGWRAPLCGWAAGAVVNKRTAVSTPLLFVTPCRWWGGMADIVSSFIGLALTPALSH